MGSLREQLIAKGLVSERQAAEAMAQEQLDAEESVLCWASVTGLEDLDACSSMDEFKHAARAALLAEPQRIQEVLSKAHRFKGNSKQQRAFIWLFYKIRDVIPNVPPDKLEDFLTRALRKHNPVIKIPE